VQVARIVAQRFFAGETHSGLSTVASAFGLIPKSEHRPFHESFSNTRRVKSAIGANALAKGLSAGRGSRVYPANAE
jgi:hypothetical protein